MRDTKELTIESREDFPDAVLVRPAWVSDRREPVCYVPVVRCRDCRFSLAHGNGCGRNQDIYDAEPDGFCAWGEKMEER